MHVPTPTCGPFSSAGALGGGRKLGPCATWPRNGIPKRSNSYQPDVKKHPDASLRTALPSALISMSTMFFMGRTAHAAYSVSSSLPQPPPFSTACHIRTRDGAIKGEGIRIKDQHRNVSLHAPGFGTGTYLERGARYKHTRHVPRHAVRHPGPYVTHLPVNQHTSR